ncbi:MAG: HNH endonuclease family protein [Christensenellales bacterium]
MNIQLHEIAIKDIFNGFVDSEEEGVVGYDGKLNIRPKYQREFVYNDKQRDAVIETIMKGFPLNVMYWVDNGDDTYEVLDGQQRTLSFCQYINGDFSLNEKYFHSLTQTEKEKILDYKCMIYFCSGNDLEKLEWFKTINIAGVKLTDQELRNAVYTGEWLTSAKTFFSKSNCPAYNIAKDYVAGSALRQDYLEKAIEWISKGNIENYMSFHQHDSNANELWIYFKNVIDWVKLTFPKYRKEMKGVEWGKLFDENKSKIVDIAELEEKIKKLMIDDDVTNKKGIFEYVLTGNEKCLNIRAFTESQKRRAYEMQDGICAICHKHFDYEQMEGDHITPWSDGGKTVAENCQMLCKSCNRIKSNI